MTANGWIQILLFFLAILAVTAPLGAFMYRVLEGERHFLRRPLGWLERLIYRAAGVDSHEQAWPTYAGCLLATSAVTMLVTYAILRLQHLLPFNPQKLGPVEALSSFNTASSFTTNTNWQGYVGETTMSYFSQMAGLAWHNFISAAAGIAIAVALARGLTRRGEGKGPGTIGNFWVDLTRATVYILLPISIVGALVLVWQGVPQNFDAPAVATTLQGAEQHIASGPIASQEWIKELGTNGGQMLVWGFFISTVACYHGTYTINSLCHVWGSRRYQTGDDSRNNLLLALITLGEGWHNNHHRYPASARQGFYWWEIDLTYYGLRLLAALGLIRDLKQVPARIRAAHTAVTP